MSFRCPNGHESQTGDYCDRCGARIEGAAGEAASPDPASGPAPSPGAGGPATPDPNAGGLGTADPSPGPGATGTAGPSSAGEERCPVCGTPRVGQDRFCEVCGYDYTTQTGAAGGGMPAVGPTATPAWQAVAVADREYFDRVAPEGVTFPIHCPARTFLLSGEQIRIGRRSNTRGIQPEIDLSGAPEDGAISHLHCILLHQPDGSYSLVDPGSTNGTTLNDDPIPVMANISMALSDGDRIHLGAWTTITIRALGAAPGPAGQP